MNDIFEVEPTEVDPWLDKLFMQTATGTVGISLDVYNRAISEGMSPDEAYERAFSPPDSNSVIDQNT